MLRAVRSALPVCLLVMVSACAQEQPKPDEAAAGPTREPSVEVLPGQVKPAEVEKAAIAPGVLDAKRAVALIAPLEPGKELAPGWTLREPMVFAKEMQIRVVNGDRFIAVRCLPDDGKATGFGKSKSFVLELGLAGVENAEAQPIAQKVVDAVVANDPGGLELPAESP